MLSLTVAQKPECIARVSRAAVLLSFSGLAASSPFGTSFSDSRVGLCTQQKRTVLSSLLASYACTPTVLMILLRPQTNRCSAS